MPIFIDEGGKYKKLQAQSLTKERALQQLVERNLFELFDMHLLASEYPTIGGRIDTFAVDITGAPVIIEYKLAKNDNIINQGLSYLRWLKAQKVEFFEMLLIKKLGNEIAGKLKIDWQNPRVIYIAESYSKFDLDTVEVIPMRLELYRYRIYEKGIFSIEPLNIIEKLDDKDKVIKAVEGDIPGIENNHKNSAQVEELFHEFKSRVLQIDEQIFEKKTNFYIAYSVSKNFAEVYVLKKGIKIHLRPVAFDDPRGVVEKIPDTYNWTLNRRVYLRDLTELDYVMKLVEQSYKDVI